MHLDPSIPLDAPKDVIARIRKNGYGQRSRVRRANKVLEKFNAKAPPNQQKPLIIIEDFDIIELFTEQNWTCQCFRVPNHTGCYKRVDITKAGRHPEAPAIGHINNTGNGGHHVRTNVGIMRNVCNAKICYSIEKARSSKIARLSRAESGLNADGTQHAKKSKKAIPKRPWGAQAGFKPNKGRKIQGKRFDGTPIL